MTRNVLTGIALVVVIGWALLSMQGTRTKGSRQGPAPNITIAALDGKKTSLADLKGKVVLIDFWGTWCGPCRTSIPGIERMYKKYKDRGFEVLGVALESDGGKQVPAFVEEMGMTYRVGLPTSGSEIQAYDPSSVPLMVVVDRKGEIQKRVPGYSPGLEAEIDQLIYSLL